MKQQIHFKRQNKRSTLSKIIIAVMVVTLTFLIKNLFTNDSQAAIQKKEIAKAEEKVKEEKQLQAEADLTKALLELRDSKAERYVTEINNNIEYITLTQDGKNSVIHSRTTEDAGFWDKTFKESSVKVNFDYQAIFSISTKDITMYSSNGTVYIKYDTNSINVKSIEVSNIATKSKKDWFGKEYSNQEVVSIVDLAKEKIHDELNSDLDMKSKSCENLNTYFTEIAKNLDIEELVINDSTVIDNKYEFIDKGMIQYNHGSDPLQNIEYIVIHSSGVKNIAALQFYNNLNSCTQTREANAHFFIDDKNVVQCLPINIQSWSVGCKNPKINATNSNTLNIEIAEFDDTERQQKAIENASSFVKDVLLKSFPNAQVIKHRDIKSTKCPSILSNEEFNTYFKEN